MTLSSLPALLVLFSRHSMPARGRFSRVQMMRRLRGRQEEEDGHDRVGMMMRAEARKWLWR